MSTRAANDTVPAVPVLRRTEKVEAPSFMTMTSSFPSPSMSAKTTSYGFNPTPKSTFSANEPLVRLPLVLVLRSTETVWEV